MEFGAFALEVRVHGRAVKEYRHGEEVWIEGRKGTEFVLRLENRSGKRVLAVPTIDGLSVMDGKEASFDSNGYILNPWQHLDIPGWRLDNDKVASFRFNKTGKSYASRAGTPGNIGIIGCAFFEEKVIPVNLDLGMCRGITRPSHPGVKLYKGTGDGSCMDWMPSSFCSFGKGAPAAAGPAWCSDVGESSGGMSVNCCNSSQGQTRGVQEEVRTMSSVAPSLGTEFGSELSHRVVTTTFSRPEKPNVEMAVRYGDRDELQQRGVDFDQRPVAAHKPSAFPKEETGCKPPPGWSGR